jgi:hypothetical protein
MKPYLVEGLDCSGKKTVAALVREHFLQSGEKPVKCYVGPLVQSPLKLLDDRLTHIGRALHRGELADILRRWVYLAGPVIDGLFFRIQKDTTPLKVSSHYRAHARAIIQNDSWMLRWFERTRQFNISFGGCTHITASFEKRVERHRQDIAKGRTEKQEDVRFLNNNKEAFLQWDKHLLQLLVTHIPFVQSISSEESSSELVALQVIDHIKYCREQGAIP